MRQKITWVVAVTLATGISNLEAQTTARQTDAGSSNPLIGHVVNVIDWDGGRLPKLYERSDQLPLTLEDVQKLSDSKFASAAIVKMIEERRCACDASVDALVGLKNAGVEPEVIQAVSLHSLKPNRSVGLRIVMDFEGLGGASKVSSSARKGYLYLILPDGDRERIFLASIHRVLSGSWQQDALVDNSDLLLPKKVRRVVFESEVTLKTYGPKRAMVFLSGKPDIYTSADIPKEERQGIQYFEFQYPESSLERTCSLQVLHRQDALLADKWELVRTHFECEWD